MAHCQRIAVFVLILFSAVSSRATEPDIEVYGKLPQFRGFSISPDGKHYAYIQRIDDIDYFIVKDLKTHKLVGGANTSNIKARGTEFVTNKHVLLRATETRTTLGYRGRLEVSGAIAYNIKTKAMKLLLRDTENLHPAQTGLGKIVGLNPDSETAYMPGYSDARDPPYNLYKVNLNTGRGKLYTKGNRYVVHWFVTGQGEVLAREEYDEKHQEHRVVSKIDGDWKTIYSRKTPVPEISIQALSADNQSLLFVYGKDDNEAVYSLSLHNGAIQGPEFFRNDQDIDYLLTDINRKLTGIAYSGFLASYQFMDPRDNAIHRQLQATYPGSSIDYLATTKNKNQVMINVSGNDAPAAYTLVDVKKHAALRIATEYKVNAIGEIKAIRYPARDGLKIPAIVTYPPGVAKPSQLPLIALPHGGPASYDRIEFDWLAQYLAAKGYLVLQPNFRGSTGFGWDFRQAGFRRWGREMQDDVSDGINALVAAGQADPARVCIVGASYGGYSALAGAVFTPELYRCAIAISAVADLPRMLRDDKYKYGTKHWFINAWRKYVGDEKTQEDLLDNISPVNFAENVRSPVLLIHGKDDTVVPISQSKMMAKALKKAGKKYKFIKLKGEDHWLSTSETRLATLQAIDRFLTKYNPVQQ